ncbi:MAG: serine hydrolase domain-containing protein [Pyrinomonadaceae bacterium]
MKKQIIIAFIVVIAFVISCSAQTTNDESLSAIEWIEKAIDTIVKDNEVPAVVVALIKDGKVEKYISRGVLNRNTNNNADENTMFQIGSLTKSFTGIIANNLINEGKLDVDASITKYLPDSLSPKTKTKLQPINVKDILHHRSGLPRDSKIVKRFGNDPMVCCYTEKDLLDDLEILELEFTPGEKSSYSNFGYGLLGYILERASGKTYEELLQTYVSQKLGLKNTTTIPSESQKKLLATPYRKENRDYETKPFEMGKLVSAGGIYSTISDLSKLMTAQLADYREFSGSRKDSVLMLTKHTKPFNDRLSYGYGMFVTNEGGYGHGGDVDGFASGYTFIPENNIGVIFLTSSGGSWVGRFEDVIVGKLRDKPVRMPKARKTISVPKEKLGRYTGKYVISESQIFNLVQNGKRLEVYIQESFGPITLYFESENKLFAKTLNVELEFEFDDTGKYSGVSGTLNGRKIEIRKIE